MSKIFFVSWVPDACKAKTKMLYASSKQALRNALDGVQLDHQATDYDESPRRNSTNARDFDEFAAKPIFESGGEMSFHLDERDGTRARGGARNRVVSLAVLRREDFERGARCYGGRRADASDDVMRVQIPLVLGEVPYPNVLSAPC